MLHKMYSGTNIEAPAGMGWQKGLIGWRPDNYGRETIEKITWFRKKVIHEKQLFQTKKGWLELPVPLFNSLKGDY